MEFTTKVQAALGIAAIVPDGDSIVLASRAWMIVLPMASQYFDEDELELIHYPSGEGDYIDYRALNAREINLEDGTFLPPRGRKAVALIGDIHISIDQIHETVESQSEQVFQATHNLSEMYREGKATPQYPEKAAQKKDTHSTVPKGGKEAHAFLFSFDNRELAIDGSLLRGVHALGGDLVVCADLSTHPDGLKSVGINFPGDAFGLLAPLASTGNHEGPHGPMCVDAQWVSWRDPSHAIEMMEDAYHFFAPAKFDVDKSCLEQSTSDHRVRKVIDLLRWHGSEDEEIDEFLSKFAQPSWERLANSYLDRLDTLVESVPEVLLRNRDWEIATCRRQMMENQSWLIALSSWLNVDLDLPELPDMEVG
jgi:hypothetical protein